jgi:hypothetical protein
LGRPHRLDPAKPLLDALANALADLVAGMARGAPVDCRAPPEAAQLTEKTMTGPIERTGVGVASKVGKCPIQVSPGSTIPSPIVMSWLR